MSWTRLLAWHPQPIPLLLIGCVLGGVLYLAGAIHLHRRGVHWPAGRGVCWLLGIASIAAACGTGIAGYGMRSFSVHMVQHMTLGMVTPIFLILGAPITLALRALPARPRGGRSMRGLLLVLLHSRVARILAHPLVTIPLFLASLYGLYFTSLFDLAMSSWLGHYWMLAHFLVVGLLFFWEVLGVDPTPHRRSPPVRMLELVVIMPFHAFFGIAIMMSSTPILKAFTTPPASWRLDAFADQHTAGGIAWAFSELPTLIVLLVVFAQWWRSDRRQAATRDRAVERHGDHELDAYNAYLARLAEQGKDHS
ncbi:cytochrome c oxidase assembly protein [Actinopolymorpha pittospori]